MLCYDKKVTERRLIVAYGANGEIGAQNALLWNMPADMKRFRTLTMGASVIMGGNTWRSIGRPLPGRENIVLTRGVIDVPDVIAVRSLQEAFERASRSRCYIIGGSAVYAAALEGGSIGTIDATEVHATFPDADSFFSLPSGWTEVLREAHSSDVNNRYDYDFVTYRNHLLN